jgi:hypothetical protein
MHYQNINDLKLHGLPLELMLTCHYQYDNFIPIKNFSTLHNLSKPELRDNKVIEISHIKTYQ